MTIKETNRLLSLYMKAINRIDDYFEYRHQSEVDKKYVVDVLNQLTIDLSETNK